MPANPSSLSDLLRPKNIAVTSDQAEQLTWLGEELLRWNRSRNLTAITKWAEVVEKHLVDSLLLLPHVPATGRLLDIGSGAGFPSLPLKIARPDLEVVSVDAVAKKIFFQRHVMRALKLKNFLAVHNRIETCKSEPAFAAPFDLATARAVAGLEILAELAEPYLRAGGLLLAMKGPEGMAELETSRQRLATRGWQCRVELSQLPGSGASRSLVILRRQNAAETTICSSSI